MAGELVLDGDAEDRFAVFYHPRVVYGRRDGAELTLGLLAPWQPDGAPRPLLVYVQGGGFVAQDIARGVPQLSVLAHRGYAVATVAHRPVDAAPFPGQIADVCDAVAFLCAHGREYGVDASRVGLWGTSSGGYTAAMVALAAHDLGDGVVGPPVAIRGVATLWAPVDLVALDRAMDPDDPARRTSGRARLLGGRPAAEVPELARRASPLSHLASGRGPVPPFLIAHGDADQTVPFAQSRRLYEALTAAGGDATLLRVRGGGHSRGIWTAQLLDVIGAFFDRTVLPGG